MKTNVKKLSKSEFIRSQPKSLTPIEVVQKAKVAGIALKKTLVSQVRSRAKTKKLAGTKAKTITTKKSPRTGGKKIGKRKVTKR